MTTVLDTRRSRQLFGVLVGLTMLLLCASPSTGQVAYDVLHAFTGKSDGGNPVGSLVQAADGDFYGTTFRGGDTPARPPRTLGGVGTVFKLTAAGVLTTLHSFDCFVDGCIPSAGLVQGRDGNFYGTTDNFLQEDSARLDGTAFKITPAGLLTTLHIFDCFTEGCHPQDPLIEGTDGNFYGVIPGRGSNFFKITPGGAFTVWGAFSCSTGPCFQPSSLVRARDGNFYAMSNPFAPLGGGIFRITDAGILTPLHSFDCLTEGCSLMGRLIQAADDNFYGVVGSFSSALFAVFKMTPTGNVTTVHALDCFDGGVGCFVSGLTQASNGNLYGVTGGGGPKGGGSVFRLTPAGTLTPLHYFDCATEGCGMSAPLIQGRDGNLYGTAPNRGPRGAGVVFRLAGRLSSLSPAKVWLGLKNSDDVGLRLDLRAEVFVDQVKVAEGRLDNVRAGSSGFGNANLRAIPLELTNGPVDFPVVSAVTLRVSARRSCSNVGHSSGTARLWYNGQPVDSGTTRDADSGLDIVSGNTTTSRYLRPGSSLGTMPGSSRQAVDVRLDSMQPCPTRAFSPFGTWTTD